MNCLHCDKVLTGKRTKWCSNSCQYRARYYSDLPRWREYYRKQQVKYHEANPEKRKEVAEKERLRRQSKFYLDDKYGLPRGTAKKLLEEAGCCAICGEVSERLVIDHDHITGQVRGVLDDKCNTALGFMSDDPNRLEAAAQYIRSEGNRAPPEEKQVPVPKEEEILPSPVLPTCPCHPEEEPSPPSPAPGTPRFTVEFMSPEEGPSPPAPGTYC